MDSLFGNLIDRTKKLAGYLSGVFDHLDRRLSIPKLIGVNLVLYLLLFVPACLETRVSSMARLLHHEQGHYLARFLLMSALALLEGAVFAMILAGLYVLFWYFSSRRAGRLNYTKIIGTGLLFALLVIGIKPSCEDILFYIFRGRVESIYRKNPYTVSYSQFPDDKFSSVTDYQSQKELTSVYGPLFGHLSRLLTGINKDSITVNVLIFKLFNLFLYLIGAWLVIRIISWDCVLSHPGKLLFYCWQPLVILDLILGGHNDMLIVVFFLMLIFCIQRNKPNLGLIFLSLGILTKITPAILFPHYLVYSLKSRNQREHGYLNLVLALVFSMMLSVIMSFPYLNTPAVLQGFAIHSASLNLFQTLLKGLLDLPALFSDSLVLKAAKIISWAIFLPLYGRKLLHVWRDPTQENLFRSSLYTLALFIILVNPKYWSWYLTWIIPFLIPLHDELLSKLFTVWSFSTLSAHVPFVIFRKYYYAGGPLKILFDLTIVYGLPLLYFCYLKTTATQPLALDHSQPLLHHRGDHFSA